MEGSNYILIHSIVVQKRDGTVLISCGKTIKDPVLVSGMISALASIGEELVPEKQDLTKSEIEVRYHNFGRYMITLSLLDNLIIYIITDIVEPKLIDDLSEYIRELSDFFFKNIWVKYKDDNKILSLPDQEIEKFEDIVVALILAKRWIDKFRFSDLYLKSSAGEKLLGILYSNFLKRFSYAFGISITQMLLESAQREIVSIENIAARIKIEQGRKKEYKIIFRIASSESPDKAIEFLKGVYIKIFANARSILGNWVLQGLDLLDVRRRHS
ncbi:MAG: hypothetical protein ACP6IQ_01715 [Candidatus Njordarchaeia archaeon]